MCVSMSEKGGVKQKMLGRKGNTPTQIRKNDYCCLAPTLLLRVNVACSIVRYVCVCLCVAVVHV